MGDSRVETCVYNGVALNTFDLPLQQGGLVAVFPSGPNDSSALCICSQRSSAVEMLLVPTAVVCPHAVCLCLLYAKLLNFMITLLCLAVVR